MSDSVLKAPRMPCGSCPYRRDVPSGIWMQNEYDKLPEYDGPTWSQNPALFMCHQRNNNICGGWLACHNPRELLALRFPHNIDPAVFQYQTNVPMWKTGGEARRHGLRKIHQPSRKAKKMISGLLRQRESQSDGDRTRSNKVKDTS